MVIEQWSKTDLRGTDHLSYHKHIVRLLGFEFLICKMKELI